MDHSVRIVNIALGLLDVIPLVFRISRRVALMTLFFVIAINVALPYHILTSLLGYSLTLIDYSLRLLGPCLEIVDRKLAFVCGQSPETEDPRNRSDDTLVKSRGANAKARRRIRSSPRQHQEIVFCMLGLGIEGLIWLENWSGLPLVQYGPLSPRHPRQ